MRRRKPESRGLPASGVAVLIGIACGWMLSSCSVPYHKPAEEEADQALRSTADDSFAAFVDKYELPAEPAIRASVESLDRPGGVSESSAPDGAERREAEQGEQPEPWLRIKEIGIAEREGTKAVLVKLSRAPEIIDYFSLPNPNRVVIDLGGAVDSVQGPGSYVADDELIERVRVGVEGERIRIVADIASEEIPEYSVAQRGAEVALLLGGDEPPGTIAPAQTLYESEDPRVALGALSVGGESAGESGSPLAQQSSPEPATRAESRPLLGGEGRLPSAPQEEEPNEAQEGTSHDAELDSPETIEVPLEKIERVPERPAALALSAVAGEAPPTPGPSEAEGGAGQAAKPAPKYTGEPISLDFKNADIQNVLRIIADVSGLNIVATEDVSGRVTVRLKNVPWDQALDVILQANGLDKERQGNVIRISSLDRLREEREKARAAQDALTQAEPLEVKYIRVNYAKVDKAFMDKIKSLLTDRGSATWDERTNTIVIRDVKRGVDDASDMVAAFDMQTPQVLIESAIVEAGDDFTRDLGIQWGYNLKAGPEVGNNTGLNFPGTVDVGGTGGGSETFPALPGFPFIADFPAATAGGGAGSALDLALGSLDGSQSLSARLSALEQANKVKIISRPRVVTINNVKATIQSLRILRVRLPSTGTVISTGEGGVAGTAQAATEEIPIGIILEVTPQVSSDGFIFLDLRAKSSTTAQTSTDNIPDEVSREAESHVLVPDGETFVLGGIYRDETRNDVRGVPYLKDIPALGWLFRNHFYDDKRQELLVFVTPHIIKGSATVANLPSAKELWQSRNGGGK